MSLQLLVLLTLLFLHRHTHSHQTRCSVPVASFPFPPREDVNCRTAQVLLMSEHIHTDTTALLYNRRSEVRFSLTVSQWMGCGISGHSEALYTSVTSAGTLL